MSDDNEVLYKEVGQKIREARKQSGQKLSQEKLARHLQVSRASIVNIEAGRQHAPLHLLWRIAEALETDLALLIPRRDELFSSVASVQLDKKTIQKIQQAAKGSEATQKAVVALFNTLKSTNEDTTSNTKIPNRHKE